MGMDDVWTAALVLWRSARGVRFLHRSVGDVKQASKRGNCVGSSPSSRNRSSGNGQYLQPVRTAGLRLLLHFSTTGCYSTHRHSKPQPQRQGSQPNAAIMSRRIFFLEDLLFLLLLQAVRSSFTTFAESLADVLISSQKK